MDVDHSITGLKKTLHAPWTQGSRDKASESEHNNRVKPLLAGDFCGVM